MLHQSNYSIACNVPKKKRREKNSVGCKVCLDNLRFSHSFLLGICIKIKQIIQKKKFFLQTIGNETYIITKKKKNIFFNKRFDFFFSVYFFFFVYNILLVMIKKILLIACPLIILMCGWELKMAINMIFYI